jgi:hypothetical protein
VLLKRPIQTRFRYGFPTRVNLATQRKLAGSFFKRHAVTTHKGSLRRIVGTWFQVLFHSPPGVLFTFPSRYLSAIGHRGVFRLNGWSRQIHTEFQGFRVTWDNTPELLPYTYGAITLYGATFQWTSTSTVVSYSAYPRQRIPNAPTTPHAQRLPAITRMGFSLIRFRSPLLSESLLFSLPVGTEMFHFPTFPPRTLYIQVRVTGHDSSWVSPFGHPRITARLPTPQGLSQAPTSFIGSRCQGIHHVPFIACLTNTTQQQLLQRCSRPLCRSQTTNPPTTTGAHHTHQQRKEASSQPARRLIPQGPTVCQTTHPDPPPTRFHTHPPPRGRPGSTETDKSSNTGPSSTIPLVNTTMAHHTDGGGAGRVLLRKEVIQPHLPVRLPCYDFVPIASPTFDGSLPYGLGHRLRVLPTFVT